MHLPSLEQHPQSGREQSGVRLHLTQTPRSSQRFAPGQSAFVTQFFIGSPCARLVSPSEASITPARPMPNFFSAPRRVTDWARLLVSSSNLSFITFLFGLW